MSSFLVGTSPANQRIESLWSQFHKDRVLWWRNLFFELSSLGFIDSSMPVFLECLRFCFMHLLRKELDEFTDRWNSHLLAKRKGSKLPRRRPNALYYLPELYNAVSCRKSVAANDLDDFDIANLASELDDCRLQSFFSW